MATDTTSSGVSISPIENPLINYAAALDYQGVSAYWSAQASDAQDALDKAQYLIDSATNLSTGQDAEYHMNDEDTELVSMNVQVAAQEINRANANISVYSNKAQLAESKAKTMFQIAGDEIDRFIKANQDAYSAPRDRRTRSR